MGARPPGPFEYHPVTAETVEGAANRIVGSKGPLIALDPAVRSAEQRATGQVHGQLEGPIRVPFQTIDPDIAALARAAAYSGQVVFEFAEAVRIFDDGVARLNTQFAGLKQKRTEHESQRIGSGSLRVPPSIEEMFGEEVAALRHQYDAVLVPDLDAAAELAKYLLDNGATEDNVQLLWVLMGGRGPVMTSFRYLFPEHGLSEVNAETEMLAALSKPGLGEHLVDVAPVGVLTKLLNNGSIPKSVRKLIRGARPDVLKRFAKEWKLETAGRVPDVDCLPHSGGGIVGPDGRVYAVTVPQQPQRDVPVMTRPGDVVPDDGAGSGWSTIGAKQGTFAHGEPVTGLERAVWIASGTKYPGDTWSIGRDQSEYMTVTPDGRVVLNPDIYVPDDEYERPTSLPPAGHRSVNVADYAEFIANLGDGAVTGNRVEANRHATSNVIFQENADGSLRAVISLNQVRTNGSDVYIDTTYAQLTPNGEVVPVEHP